MDNVVKGKPLAEMSHEGVKFLLEEMVQKRRHTGAVIERVSSTICASQHG